MWWISFYKFGTSIFKKFSMYGGHIPPPDGSIIPVFSALHMKLELLIIIIILNKWLLVPKIFISVIKKWLVEHILNIPFLLSMHSKSISVATEQNIHIVRGPYYHSCPSRTKSCSSSTQNTPFEHYCLRQIWWTLWKDIHPWIYGGRSWKSNYRLPFADDIQLPGRSKLTRLRGP